jgi:hypothetical protein
MDPPQRRRRREPGVRHARVAGASAGDGAQHGPVRGDDSARQARAETAGVGSRRSRRRVGSRSSSSSRRIGGGGGCGCFRAREKKRRGRGGGVHGGGDGGGGGGAQALREDPRVLRRGGGRPRVPPHRGPAGGARGRVLLMPAPISDCPRNKNRFLFLCTPTVYFYVILCFPSSLLPKHQLETYTLNDPNTRKRLLAPLFVCKYSPALTYHPAPP